MNFKQYLNEARGDSPKGDKVTTKDNPIVKTYDDGGLSGGMNLSTAMNITGISEKNRKALLKLIYKGKKFDIPASMMVDYEKEYAEEGRKAPKISFEYDEKFTKSDMNEGEMDDENLMQKMADADINSKIKDGVMFVDKDDVKNAEKVLKKCKSKMKVQGSLNEMFSKNPGYETANDYIEKLGRMLSPKSPLAKGIANGMGKGYLDDFKKMEKHMSELESIWLDIVKDVESQ